MSSREDNVREFCVVAGQPTDGVITDELVQFRIRLLKEELVEVEQATDVMMYEHCCGMGATTSTKAEMLKELCDLQYVLSGAVVALGFADVFDEAFSRVHQSNMSKFPATYAPDGKVLKGPNYKKPYLEDLV